MTDSASPLLIAPPPPGWSGGSAGVGRHGARAATASLVLGIVAMVLNVFLVPTVLAIVFGAVALSRGTAARTRAIVGIALGALGVFAALVQLAILIPVVVGVMHVPFHERMAAFIEQDVNAQGGTVIQDVRCPVAGRLWVGKQITCAAVTDGGAPIRIPVTFTSSTGAYTYRALSMPPD